MAIEIVPKETTRPSPLQNILLYILIFLLVTAILSYLVLDFYFIKKANQKLLDLENQIKTEKGSEYTTLEDQLKGYQKKIEDFSQLLLSHKRSLNLFNFIEENTHPRAFFSAINIDIPHNQVKLLGKTESFQTLGEQLIIFKNAKSISSIKLSDIKIGKEGKIEFTINFTLNPSLFTQ